MYDFFVKQTFMCVLQDVYYVVSYVCMCSHSKNVQHYMYVINVDINTLLIFSLIHVANNSFDTWLLHISVNDGKIL